MLKEKIKNYIEENGITQKQFAMLVKVSEPTLSRVLTGKSTKLEKDFITVTLLFILLSTDKDLFNLIKEASTTMVETLNEIKKDNGGKE